MSFLGSLFGGSNPTLNKNINQFGQEAGFAQGVGQKGVTDASKWYSDVLSGDPSKMAEAVAPETAALQGQAQQKKNQLAQFGPRSGGTEAAVAGMDADTRAQIIKLLGGLQSGTAGAEANLGTAEQGMALNAQQMQDEAAMQQQELESNSILGGMLGGLGKVAGGALGNLAKFGLGKIPGIGGILAGSSGK